MHASAISPVTRESREFLTCGVLAHGFARARCERCAFEHLLPFSCKRVNWSRSWSIPHSLLDHFIRPPQGADATARSAGTIKTLRLPSLSFGRRPGRLSQLGQ